MRLTVLLPVICLGSYSSFANAEISTRGADGAYKNLRGDLANRNVVARILTAGDQDIATDAPNNERGLQALIDTYKRLLERIAKIVRKNPDIAKKVKSSKNNEVRKLSLQASPGQLGERLEASLTKNHPSGVHHDVTGMIISLIVIMGGAGAALFIADALTHV